MPVGLRGPAELAAQCASCDRAEVVDDLDEHGQLVECLERDRGPEWGHGVVISVEPDRMTVLFDENGYRTLSVAAVRQNNLLTAADES